MLRTGSERGASAVLIASSLVLLIGVVAVALDVSAAFNERNQDQNAGDNGVMAGALEKAMATPDEQLMVSNALDFVQANLTADFPGGSTDPTWIAMWRACVDDGNPGWIPLPEPVAWGGAAGATLDCISQTTSLLRVRVPDQFVDTAFGQVLGADSLSTHAVSIAKVALVGDAPPVVPFGVNSGASAGEHCLSSASGGTAYAPCVGSQTGAYGPIISPLFADFGTHAAECNGNTIRWFERNLVWGLDHRLQRWPHEAGYPTPTAWSQALYDSMADTHEDACVLDPDGNAVPSDGIPINTVRVDTGFPDPGVTNALVSDMMFDGRPSRLQLPSTGAPRPLMDQNVVWDVDNVGPWRFLTDDLMDPPECQRSTYDPSLTTDQKTARFETCITISPLGEVFDTTITDSPRFVWAPEYVLESPPGSKFTPIRGFRPAFIAGVWMNCPSPNSGQPCGAIFFPDEDVTGPICDGTFPSCKKVTVDQVSMWLLPETALPQSVLDDFDSAFDNLEPELYQ